MSTTYNLEWQEYPDPISYTTYVNTIDVALSTNNINYSYPLNITYSDNTSESVLNCTSNYTLSNNWENIYYSVSADVAGYPIDENIKNTKIGDTYHYDLFIDNKYEEKFIASNARTIGWLLHLYPHGLSKRVSLTTYLENNTSTTWPRNNTDYYYQLNADMFPSADGSEALWYTHTFTLRKKAVIASDYQNTLNRYIKLKGDLRAVWGNGNDNYTYKTDYYDWYINDSKFTLSTMGNTGYCKFEVTIPLNNTMGALMQHISGLPPVVYYPLKFRWFKENGVDNSDTLFDTGGINCAIYIKYFTDPRAQELACSFKANKNSENKQLVNTTSLREVYFMINELSIK